MKRILLIFVTIAAAILPALADEFVIDTSYVKKAKVINDYSMIGIQYGGALSIMMFDPSRAHENVFIPVNAGVMYTKYGKIFGYMPYFGVQVGVFYTRDAYKFPKAEEGYVGDHILGAKQAVIDEIEIPAQAHMHVDFWKMKLIANVGIFGGYRLRINRFDYETNRYGLSFDDPGEESGYLKYKNSFHPNENRWDFGVRGGLGFAFVFDPVEIHITGTYKFSWSNLHQPNVNRQSMEHDQNSKYYYRWSYPTNVIVAVGVHYQLSGRIGTSRRELRRQARDEIRQMFRQATEPKEAKEPEETEVTKDTYERKPVEGYKIYKGESR